MLTTIAVFGWLLLIVSVGLFAFRFFTEGPTEKQAKDWHGNPAVDEDDNPIIETISDRPRWLEPFKPVYLGLTTVVAIFFILANSLFFYARPGHQYYLLSPFGNKTAVFNQGFKWRGFAQIQEWQKFVDVKCTKEGESTEGIEGVIPGGIPVMFIDRVSAQVYLSARFQMPNDPETFIKIVEDFRHPTNLVNNTLLPTVREQVINNTYMYSASGYISGGASDYRQSLDDQLKNGGFSVEREEYFDTIYSPIQVDGQRVISDIRTTYEVKKRKDRNGNFIRIPHEIGNNNVWASQVIVDQVYLEPAFKKRLEQQRDISAQKRIEFEKIETAKVAQQAVVAEGERDKAKERVAQELDQVSVLISIETKKKEEVTKKELAAIALETARLDAQALRVTKDAEAYANRQLVSAGLTPQERMKMQIEIANVTSKNLAGPNGLTLPSFYMGGGGNASGANGDAMQQLMTVLIAQMAQNQKSAGK